MFKRDIDFTFPFSLLNILKTINILHFFKHSFLKITARKKKVYVYILYNIIKYIYIYYKIFSIIFIGFSSYNFHVIEIIIKKNF